MAATANSVWLNVSFAIRRTVLTSMASRRANNSAAGMRRPRVSIWRPMSSATGKVPSKPCQRKKKKKKKKKKKNNSCFSLTIKLHEQLSFQASNSTSNFLFAHVLADSHPLVEALKRGILHLFRRANQVGTKQTSVTIRRVKSRH